MRASGAAQDSDSAALLPKSLSPGAIAEKASSLASALLGLDQAVLTQRAKNLVDDTARLAVDRCTARR